MARCLVTGATGAVGPSVVEALRAAGCTIRTFSRGTPPPGLFDRDVEVCTGDVADSSALAAAIRGIDVVVHLAALLHEVEVSPDLHREYERVNVGGTGAAVAAAVDANVKRLVFFSSIAVYGDSGGLVLTEDSPVQPATVYARTKAMAEEIVLRARRGDHASLGTVLRLAAVYGPRVKGNYQRLARTLARRRFLSIGDGRNRRTLVHEQDAGQAAVLAALHPAAAGRRYNVSDGRYHAVRDIVAAICEALGRTPPRIAVPVSAARAAAGLLEAAALLLGRTPPVRRATIDKYVEDIAVDGRRIQAELGFSPRLDLRVGWRQTVEQMRRNGDL